MITIIYICAGVCVLALLKPLGFVVRIMKELKQAWQLCPIEKLEDMNTFTEEDKPYVGKVNVTLRNYPKRGLLGWCCKVTVPLLEMDEQGMPTKKENKAICGLIHSIDLSMCRRSASLPFPLIAGYVAGNSACNIYWMVSDPEEIGKLLCELKLNRKIQYTMWQDPFWTQYNSLLEELQ